MVTYADITAEQALEELYQSVESAVDEAATNTASSSTPAASSGDAIKVPPLKSILKKNTQYTESGGSSNLRLVPDAGLYARSDISPYTGSSLYCGTLPQPSGRQQRTALPVDSSNTNLSPEQQAERLHNGQETEPIDRRVSFEQQQPFEPPPPSAHRTIALTPVHVGNTPDDGLGSVMGPFPIPIQPQPNNTYDDVLGPNVPEHQFIPPPSRQPVEPTVTTPAQDETVYEKTWRNEHILLNIAEGDTLVFLNPPQELLRPDRKATLGYAWAMRRTFAMRIHMKSLLDTGSTVFQKMFNPTYQHRVLRRKKLVNDLPPGVKYVVDLTLPEDGDDASLLCADVMLSPGLQHWFKAGKVFSVDQALCAGLDDNETELLPPDNMVITTWGEPRCRKYDPAKLNTPTTLPAEFSPVRLHCAIERLIYCIVNESVVLDSAPKMWTLFCVARFYECLPVVRDLILSWIFSPHNVRFIEVCPEICLRIGEGFQNYDLCRCAYAVIIGEAALVTQIPPDTVMTPLRRPSEGIFDYEGREPTPYGRLRDDNFGQLQDAVEYGRLTLTDRVWNAYQKLASFDWFDSLFHLYCRDAHKICPASALELKDGLKAYLSGRFRVITTGRHYLMPGRNNSDKYRNYCFNRGRDSIMMDNDSRRNNRYGGYGNSYGPMNVATRSRISLNFPVSMRIMTRSFWINVENALAGELFPARSYLSSQALELGNKNLIPVVKAKELVDLASSINRMILLSSDEPVETAWGTFWNDEDYQTYRKGRDWRPKHSASSSSANVEAAELPILSRNTDSSPAAASTGHDAQAASAMSLPIRTLAPKDLLQASNAEAHRAAKEISFRGKVYGYSPDKQARHEEDVRIRAKYDVDISNMLARWKRFNQNPEFVYPRSPELLDITEILEAAYDYIFDMIDDLLLFNVPLDPGPTDTLFCLKESEFNYLPLWAGGLDDGSGGVFAENIPDAFSGSSMDNLRKGGISTRSENSDYSTINQSDLDSAQTSLMVQDGFSDTLERRVVYSDDGLGSSINSFSDVGSVIGIEEDIKGKGKMAVGNPSHPAAPASVAASDFSEDTMATDDSEATEAIRDRIAFDNFMHEDDNPEDSEQEEKEKEVLKKTTEQETNESEEDADMDDFDMADEDMEDSDAFEFID